MTNNRRKRLNLGKVVEICWLDVTARRNVEINSIIESDNLEEYLSMKYTKGRIVRCDNGITILESEESEDGDIDETAIPNHLIKRIHTYTRDRKKQYHTVPKELRKYL